MVCVVKVKNYRERRDRDLLSTGPFSKQPDQSGRGQAKTKSLQFLWGPRGRQGCKRLGHLLLLFFPLAGIWIEPH